MMMVLEVFVVFSQFHVCYHQSSRSSDHKWRVLVQFEVIAMIGDVDVVDDGDKG